MSAPINNDGSKIMNFFKKKIAEAHPKIRVIGLRLRLSDGLINEWTSEGINKLEEDTAMEIAYQTLKQCQEAIENAKSDNKITAILPRFGLIRVECFKDISILKHTKV
jgi:hypothetical protein